MKLNKKAFTLAELMLVFTAIGILSAILMPILFSATPDKAALKAKKAYNTFARGVENLVNEEPYSAHGGTFKVSEFPEYANLNFSCEPGEHNSCKVSDFSADSVREASAFFCNNLANILNVKYADCLKRSETAELNNDGMRFGSGGSNVNYMNRIRDTQTLLITGVNSSGNTVSSRDLFNLTVDADRAILQPKYLYESLQGAPFDPENADAFNPYVYRGESGNTETIDGVCDAYFANLDDESNRQDSARDLGSDYKDFYSFITTDNTGWVVQNFTFDSISPGECQSLYIAGDYECMPGGGRMKGIDEAEIAGKRVSTSYAIICVNTGDLRNIEYEDVNGTPRATNVYGMGVNREGKIIVGGKLQRLLDEDQERDR